MSTSTGTRLGITHSLSPGLTVPCSTLPSTVVPMSLYLERMGSRSGASLLRSTTGSVSRASTKAGPSYQGILSLFSSTLVAVSAESGTKITSFLML